MSENDVPLKSGIRQVGSDTIAGTGWATWRDSISACSRWRWQNPR